MHRLDALLRKHLKRTGMSQAMFASMVGMSRSGVSLVLRGKGALFPARSAAWCTALGLTGKEAEELTDAIHLAAATPRVRTMMARLERRLSAAMRRLP